MRAFWDLSTCRQFNQVLGPIPWNIVVQYGQQAGLESDVLQVFSYVMRTLDEAYLSWQREEQRKHGAKREKSRK